MSEKESLLDIFIAYTVVVLVIYDLADSFDISHEVIFVQARDVEEAKKKAVFAAMSRAEIVHSTYTGVDSQAVAVFNGYVENIL